MDAKDLRATVHLRQRECHGHLAAHCGIVRLELHDLAHLQGGSSAVCIRDVDVVQPERASMLLAVFRFAALEQGVDRHGVSVPKVKVLLEPGYNVTRFDAILDSAAIGEPFFCGELAKVLRTLAGLCLDILYVGLK